MVGERRTILIATTNQGKLREVREILAGLPFELTTLADYPAYPDAIENGETFAENAAIKAMYYATLTGQWALADDSGLMVDALDGEPGVRSARYAGPQSDPIANNAKLVDGLERVPQEQCTARFCCAVALADPTEILGSTFARWEGVIVTEPRGKQGFGYDPHFLVPDLGLTAAEMEPEQKNHLSHRGQAFRAIRIQLERLATVAKAD